MDGNAVGVGMVPLLLWRYTSYYELVSRSLQPPPARSVGAPQDGGKGAGLLGTRLLGYEPGKALWVAGGGVSALIVIVGLIGCAIPLARALRIQPTEALGADG